MIGAYKKTMWISLRQCRGNIAAILGRLSHYSPWIPIMVDMLSSVIRAHNIVPVPYMSVSADIVAIYLVLLSPSCP